MFASQQEFNFARSPESAAMSVGQCCTSHALRSGVETLYNIRLIAIQIAGILVAMADDGPIRRQASQRYLNDQLKVYRELQRTLTESDALSTRDTLDLDGPKFKFIFTELIRLFRQALTDAGTPEPLAQNAMLQFGDLVKANDERLRIEMNKVGSR
jgi:hypothetical protein